MRTNLATNPTGEASATGWTAVPGTTGAAAAASTTATTVYGTKVIRTTWTTANTVVGAGCSFDVAVTAGNVYSFFLGLIRPSLAQTLQFQVEWRTAAATISTSTATAQAFTAGQSLSATLNGLTAPATATIARVKVLSTVGLNSIGSTLDLDGLLVEQTATAGTYFDGNSAGGYWTGTANASTSVFPATAPTLTLSTDANPCPRVLVAFVELPPSISYLNVYRVAEGRQFQVRGGVKLAAVGGVAIMDYECPFGISMTYRAEMFDATNTSLGFTSTTSLTIDPATVFSDGSRAWIHQPLKPSLAVQAYVTAGLSAVVKNTPGDVYFPEGATVGVRIGGQRQGLVNTSMTIRTDNAADADELQSMLGGYGSDFPAVLCIRTASPIRLPRTLFASVDISETPWYPLIDLVSFDMSMTEVRPPSPGLLAPTLRRADIDFAFSTRAARAAAYATRLQRDTDYTKSGIAG